MELDYGPLTPYMELVQEPMRNVITTDRGVRDVTGVGAAAGAWAGEAVAGGVGAMRRI